jgi:ABC-type bacteriocin/lantibiotic exporter with double-glycine peptidase domain
MISDSRRLLKPRHIPRTGDDTPAKSVIGYAIRMTGWHQAAACTLAVLVAVLNLAPIELQRRLIDDAISAGDARLLAVFGAAYAGVLVLHRVLKFTLEMYQGWLSESAALYTRRHLLGIYHERETEDAQEEAGQAVAIIGQETDKLAGFVGEGPSQAVVNMAIMLGVIAYMVTVQPKIAALSLLLLVPQVLLTPVMQNRLNRLTERRVELVRALGDDVAVGHARDDEPSRHLIGRVYDNRIAFLAWKFLLKGTLNFLNHLAPLSVLVWGGWLAIQGQTTVGVLVAFVSGFEKLSDPIRELINFYRTCAQSNVQHRKIAEWMMH